MATSVDVSQVLEKELTERERELEKLRSGPPEAPELRVKWEQLKSTLNKCWLQLHKHNKKAARKRWYLEGDKAGRMLAHLIKAEKVLGPMLIIRDQGGREVYTQQEINRVFLDHLRRVYTQPHTDIEEVDRQKYLHSLPIKALSEMNCENIGALIGKPEVLAAITALRTTKAPQNDGVLSEFYKTFLRIFAERLVEVYDEAYRTVHLP
ncbi:hypothetical protein NDU88_003910 [Pleurodeles waltl]|uniref:Uncharacterized protein n=1 Tax=Pleurodeles waltl TaxID=8319 RepID=A0AAV7UF19_PLEWA|nr:hypothetical protein NDU88_003910 [Pleurodeles waltl]